MPDIVLATINAKWIHPSLALRLLKANLGSLEENCEILEFALRQPLREKVEPILAARPRILGLSVSIWNHTATLELLEALQEEWNKKRDTEGSKAGQKPGLLPWVVLGGPEVSWLPEDAEIFRRADYVIRGEAEESFRALCYRIFAGKFPSGTDSPDLLLTERKSAFINQGETSVDLNSIASPYRLYTEEDLRRKLVYVEASRGCPFGCEFCLCAVRRHISDGRNNVQRAREFPLEPFLADMETLIKKGGRQFKFLDRTFNLDINRAKRIMEFFLERIEPAKGSRPLCVHFEMVPSRFPPELRDVLRRFPPGALRLELGIQTFNPQTSALVRRSGDTASASRQAPETVETLKFLRRETNAIVHADLIAGLPGEDLASFGAGFDMLHEAMAGFSPGVSKTEIPFEIQLGILKCLPGTPISRHNGAYGMKYSVKPPYEVIETGALSAAELDKVKNFARFWEILVNRNPFPEFVSRFFPYDKPVFEKFMALSDRLLEHFGRNWGIDRKDLEFFLRETEFYF